MEGVLQTKGSPETGPQLDNRRIAAGAIDLAVVAAVGLVLKTLTGGFGAATLALTVAWGLYYFFALEWTLGQTLGKRVMRLRVARADGDAPGIREVAVRTVLRVVDGIGFYIVGLATMLATGDRRQRVGDLAAGTVVTTADEAPSEPAPAAPVEAPAPVVEPPAPAPLAEDPAPPASVAAPAPAAPVATPPVEAPIEPPAPPAPVAEDPAPPAPVAEDPAPPAPVEQSPSPAPAEQSEDAPAEVEVKPMETVSPLELLMAESEKQDAGDAGQSA